VKEYLKYLKGDRVIWIIVSIMLAFSLVTVYSFVPILVKIEQGTPSGYLMKHFVYVLIGFVSMYMIHRIDSKYIFQVSKFAYYLAILLLVFTMFFGVKVNGAGRWISIMSLTFQTSDFAKLALILYISRILVKRKEKLNDWKEGIRPLMVPIIVICVLIMKDNFSTAAMLFMISMLLLFLGKVPFIKLMTIGGIGLAGAALLIALQLSIPQIKILPRLETWKNRIVNRMDSEENLIENAQANNAKLAIHNGSVFGQGVGDGKLKEYLPEAYADFYYSSYVEEFGSVSALILVLLYLILLFRILRIAVNAKNEFHSYAALGIGIHLMTQACINMLVCTGVFPVTGQNMPFLAMGGSALVMACVSVGVVQSFAREQEKVKKEAVS